MSVRGCTWPRGTGLVMEHQAHARAVCREAVTRASFALRRSVRRCQAYKSGSESASSESTILRNSPSCHAKKTPVRSSAPAMSPVRQAPGEGERAQQGVTMPFGPHHHEVPAVEPEWRATRGAEGERGGCSVMQIEHLPGCQDRHGVVGRQWRRADSVRRATATAQ